MKNVIKTTALVTLVMSLFALEMSAQTGEFKKEWTKLFDNLYFRTQTKVDKMPSDTTDFRVYGFRDKREHAAPVEVSGNVTEAYKKGDVYTFAIDGARFSVDDGDSRIKYEGRMAMYVTDDRGDSVTMMIEPLGGNWQVSDVRNKTTVNYHIKPGWNEHTGMLFVNIGKPSKFDPVPPYTVNYSNFTLPRHVTKQATFTREKSTAMKDRKLALERRDSLFLHSVLESGSRVESVPGLEVVVSEMPERDDPERVFDSEVLYYRLGDRIELSEAEVTRSGDDYLISYHGAEPKYRFTATYHNSAFPEFTEVKWEDKGVFAHDDLTRSDGSRITQIKFDITDNVLDMPQGFIMSQARALSDFNVLDFFDFNKYYTDGRIGKLRVGAYISPANESELINDGYIRPVRERVMAERERELSAVRQAQSRYDEARAWLDGRQQQLAADYDVYSVGREVIELPNNQAATPHTVKLVRQIKRDTATGGYDELFFIQDDGTRYPLDVDEDGDLCYKANGRTYWLTRVSENARQVIDNLRVASQNKAVVEKGRPMTPTFD